MPEEKSLIDDVKTSVAFFENEIKEFTKSRDDAQKRLDALGGDATEEERKNLNDEIVFFQEFIDDSQNSLELYQGRLAQLTGSIH